MAPHTDPEVVSGASQDYLVCVRNLLNSGERATVSGVARRMGVSPQAASEMIARLRGDGLVRQRGRHDLALTSRGREIADGTFRRHALVEWLLTDVIGMGWAESDREAQRLQGAISPAVEARLDELLGHPSTCPHGNPISADDAAARPSGVPLSTVASGSSVTILRITEEAEEDAALLSYLEARGLRPGVEIAVRASSGPLEAVSVEGPRGSATLGLRPASLIMVLPGSADPALFHRVPSRGLGALAAPEVGAGAAIGNKAT